MKVYSFTWNTHGTSILPDFRMDADIVTISLQECYKIPDIRRLRKVFKYCIIESMLGLQTIILSRDKIEPVTIKIGFGILGFINKGFIAIKINNAILHVNAHLSAHDHNHQKRQDQLKSILGFIKNMCKPSGIDTILLTGDLNFRIKDGIEQSAGFFKLFPQFKESKIEFKPTYKYKDSELLKSRTPSYCDRILVASGYTVNPISYASMHHITVSDHKPVNYEFELFGARKEYDLLFNVEPKDPYWRTRLTNLYLLGTEKRVLVASIALSLMLLALSYFPILNIGQIFSGIGGGS